MRNIGARLFLPMFESALERLEFSGLKELLGQRLTCSLGREALAQLAPSSDRKQIEAELARVDEALAFLERGEGLGFGSLVDPSGWMSKLNIANVVLAPEEILAAATLLQVATETRATVGAPRFRQILTRLRELAADLQDFSRQVKDIRRRILPGGEIDDHASPQLAEIRDEIHKTEQRLRRSLRRILQEAEAKNALQDEFVTLRGGRLVLPIRSDARSRPEGVVHAQSGTGQTLFLEPLQTIVHNNELVRLREAESDEIRKILRGLSERLAARKAEIESTVEVLGHLDLIFARARYGREFQCVIPRFDDKHGLTLTAVRHPLLVEQARRTRLAPKGKKKQGEETEEVVPISVALEDGNRVLVISGPNAGGKTVALKTIGLAAMAAQAAIPVPAEEVTLPLFKEVLADIGDLQSIVENLSTFSAHIVNLRQMTESAGSASLVLLDELGAATSPEEGAALGIALLEHFRERGAITVATTHHERLKSYASTTEGVLNAAVEFDEVNLRPTYRLLLGLPGVSSGIETAERFGLPKEIVGAARGNLTPEAEENAQLIRSLHATREELERLQKEVREELRRVEQERADLEEKWLKEQRKKLNELEREVGKSVTEMKRELRRVVDKIKDPKRREKLERSGMRQVSKQEAALKREVDSAVIEHLGEAARPQAKKRVRPEQVTVGAKIKLHGMSRWGQVLSKVSSDTVEAQMGPLRMHVKIADIEEVESSQKKKEKDKKELTAETQRTQSNTQREKRNLTGREAELADSGVGAPELQVRGLRVEEARERVDKFLDDSVLAGHAHVRVVHGKGTGALRAALTEMFAEHPHVATFRHPEPEFGGDGVTVITLRGN